jgi:DNA-binding transcriptional LysR family regulator
LTDNGRAVLIKAHSLLTEAAALAEAVDRSANGAPAHLKVGVSIPLIKSIQALVTEYARQFPKVDVQYQDILRATMQDKALRQGEIDIGISWPPSDQVHIASERLFDERFRVIVPKTSFLAKHKRLRLRQLADQVLLLPDQTETSNRMVLQMASEIGLKLKVSHTTSLPHEAAKNAVERWQNDQAARAFSERYFALLRKDDPVIGAGLCHYDVWWRKIQKALDPNGVSPEAGALV